MNKLFIKTSEGFVNLNNIDHVCVDNDNQETGDLLIRVCLTTGKFFFLKNREARKFLEMIPTVVDISQLNQ